MIGFAPPEPQEPQGGAEAAAWRAGQWNAVLAMCAHLSGLIAASGATVTAKHLWMALAVTVDDPIFGDLDLSSAKVHAETLALLREQIAKAEAAESATPATRPPYNPGGYL